MKNWMQQIMKKMYTLTLQLLAALSSLLEIPKSSARSVVYKAWVAASMLSGKRAVASEGAQHARKALAFSDNAAVIKS
jgi:hypothetical protein